MEVWAVAVSFGIVLVVGIAYHFWRRYQRYEFMTEDEKRLHHMDQYHRKHPMSKDEWRRK